MATIKSKEVQINSGSLDIYNFLSDLNNLQNLMPEDKVLNWKSDKETCSFTIKGLSGIGMKKESGTEGEKVHIVSHGKNPFDFTLDIDLKEANGSTKAQLTFDGNMNFMIQTMASGPLTNLFNMMADKLVSKFA
ncbi:MAG: hypothetical protein ACPGEG_05720 [Salibacteraceae bacterium]